jgi:hypothetical protein
MKKAVLAVCCTLLIALVITSLRVGRAINPQQPDQMAPVTMSNDLTMQEMTQRSELIVAGQCVETRSTWVDGRRLVTLATISVNDAIKGTSASTVTVELPGGIDSNRKHPISMNYPGAPTIQTDENVFLFLTRADSPANTYAVMGYAQGKFSIVNDQEGRPMVSRDLTKTRVSRTMGIARGQRQLTPLSEFKERIRGYLK